VTITRAIDSTQIEECKRLFEEYAKSLGFSLCFQGFEKELAGLPGDYAPPDGRLLLAYHDGDGIAAQPAGCIALHRLEPGICEMKRLYVRPEFRGRGIGRSLAEAVIREAAAIGYERMRLDTIAAKMAEAVELYRSLGFREIAPYRGNPIPTALYMELRLATVRV
jgi:putative acetyltransferase